MNVLLGAFGTRGDVQPMVALALALRARGHHVIFAAPPNFEGWIRGFGFEFHGVGVDYEAFVKGFGGNVVKALPALRREVQVQCDGLLPLMPRADVFLGASTVAVGCVFAERFRRPYRFVTFAPVMVPSAAHAAPMVPLQGLPRWLRRLSWVGNEVIWNVVLRGPMNRMRARAGLGPLQRDVWSEVLGEEVLLASEPVLAPELTDAPVPVQQPGAWLLPEVDSISQETLAFLEAGEAPIYLGFGSMVDGDPARTSRFVLAAARAAGVRLLVSRGWAGLDGPSDDRVRFIGPEPHGKLFTRCAGVIHHGGAGTTTAALRAGVPQLVVPHLLDQYYWAARLEALGLGPKAVPRRRLNERTLTAALRELRENKQFSERAREAAGRCVGDGADRTVTILERLVASSRAA